MESLQAEIVSVRANQSYTDKDAPFDFPEESTEDSQEDLASVNNQLNTPLLCAPPTRSKYLHRRRRWD